VLVVGAALLGALGCSEEPETRTLDAVQLGMTPDMAPVYEDGEMSLYEAKRSIPFPVLAPTDAQMGGLYDQPVDPFGRGVWVTSGDVEVRMSWVLSNLDDAEHTVELLVDPWNEFGRYWPGLALVDAEEGEFQPNLSGINQMFLIPGRGAGEASRIRGTYSFEDMRELAVDFATAINIIDKVEPPPPDAMDGAMGPSTLVNHAFNLRERSDDDPLIRQYIPTVIPGLTGIDLGLRTRAPAKLAVEVVIEVRGKTDQRIAKEGDTSKPLMPEPTEFITAGTAAP
jgi:hypothetical protein